jgi:hypothetical protein
LLGNEDGMKNAFFFFSTFSGGKST